LSAVVDGMDVRIPGERPPEPAAAPSPDEEGAGRAERAP